MSKRKTLTQNDTNVYEEAIRAVDEILIKDGDNWVCKVCNKSSTRNSDMRKHAELHIEGLSFPCVCGDTFRSRKQLINHKYRKHRNLWLEKITYTFFTVLHRIEQYLYIGLTLPMNK